MLITTRGLHTHSGKLPLLLNYSTRTLLCNLLFTPNITVSMNEAILATVRCVCVCVCVCVWKWSGVEWSGGKEGIVCVQGSIKGDIFYIIIFFCVCVCVCV